MNLLEPVNIEASGENALLISWQEVVSPVLHQFILELSQQLISELHGKIVDTVVSYNSLLLLFDFQTITHEQLTNKVLALLTVTSTALKQNDQQELAENVVSIPVYYHGHDLQAVASALSMTTDEVITRHSNIKYRAYALGFTPGFCYLAQLDKALMLPRKTTPLKSVPNGAVAIAEQQTAVYPSISPGGWHILGITPLSMFKESNGGATPLINVGQTVQFTSISQKEFLALGGSQYNVGGR